MNEARRPFERAEDRANGKASQISAESQARAMAEVRTAMELAKTFPRDMSRVTDAVEAECQRETMAEMAEYSYARGGTDIAGATVHLLRTIARCMTNLHYGIREIEEGERSGIKGSWMEAFAWDLETNTRASRRFFVGHWRDKKGGRGYALEDQRDIYEITANMGARRERACLEEVIPADIVEYARTVCSMTLRTKADTSQESVTKMVKAFGEYGITKQQIEKRIQRRIDAITPAQIVSLRRIYRSLVDGMSTPAEWFDVVASGESADQPKFGADALKRKLGKTKDTEPTEEEIAAAMDEEAAKAEAAREQSGQGKLNI